MLPAWFQVKPGPRETRTDSQRPARHPCCFNQALCALEPRRLRDPDLGTGMTCSPPRHCDPPNGHFECPSPPSVSSNDPVPGPSDRLVANVGDTKSGGGNGTKIKAVLVNQRYSNNAQQRYLLVDASVRLPAPALGIADRTQAQTARPVLRFFHAGQTQAYAECVLEPRRPSRKQAIYSLGLKANSVHTLLRWGRCDDPKSPGFDSIFPLVTSGDAAQLVGTDGTVVATFVPPIAQDIPMPTQPRRKPQPAVAKLLDGGFYRVEVLRPRVSIPR